MPFRNFCDYGACPNYRDVTILGEVVGLVPYFCEEHRGTKYVRCVEEHCSRMWIFDYDHEVPSAPQEDATDWLCDNHRPKEVTPETPPPIDRLIARLEAEVKHGNSHGYTQPEVWAVEKCLKWAIEERDA